MAIPPTTSIIKPVTRQLTSEALAQHTIADSKNHLLLRTFANKDLERAVEDEVVKLTTVDPGANTKQIKQKTPRKTSEGSKKRKYMSEDGDSATLSNRSASVGYQSDSASSTDSAIKRIDAKNKQKRIAAKRAKLTASKPSQDTKATTTSPFIAKVLNSDRGDQA